MSGKNSVASDSNAVLTPGKILSERRKSKKLEEREVAEALKISISRLRSIEEDDLTVFPSETYIRGHLKNYSRFLSCDEDAVLNAYDAIKSDIGLSELDQPVLKKSFNPQQPGMNRAWLIAAIVILLSILIFSYFFFSHESEVGTDHNEVVVQPEPSSSLIADEVEKDQGLVDPLSSTDSTEASLLQELQPSEQSEGSLPAENVEMTEGNEINASNIEATSIKDGESVTQETPIVVSKMTASELVKSIREQEKPEVIEEPLTGDALVFEFSDASWIQVIDAEKKILFKGLNKSGASLALNGTAPFSLVIGNVNGTALLFNGERVELKAPPGKNILRITLGG